MYIDRGRCLLGSLKEAPSVRGSKTNNRQDDMKVRGDRGCGCDGYSRTGYRFAEIRFRLCRSFETPVGRQSHLPSRLGALRVQDSEATDLRTGVVAYGDYYFLFAYFL